MPANYECTKCTRTFSSISDLNNHMSTVHRTQGGMPNSPGHGDAAYNAANRSQGGMPNSPGSSYDPYYSTANRSQGGMPNSPGHGDAAYNAANRSQGGMPYSSGNGYEATVSSLVSELNPTGSIQKQRELDAFFRSLNASNSSNNGGNGNGSGSESGSSGNNGGGGGNQSPAPAPALTDQELADFSKKYNAWVAEAAGGNPENLKNWMNFAGNPLPDDFYKPINGFIFVQGDGPKDKPNTDLKGNGNAIFAVDKDGNMFHVTSEVYRQMVDSGQTPKVHLGSQAVIDNMGVDGVMTSPTTGVLDADKQGVVQPDTPPIVTSPAPTPDQPSDNSQSNNQGGSTTTPSQDEEQSGGDGNNAKIDYERNTKDSGYAYPWSAAQSTGTTDVKGTIAKAVAFMNENEGKDYVYDDVKGTIVSKSTGSFMSRKDTQALNHVIVDYYKQDFKLPGGNNLSSSGGGIESGSTQFYTPNGVGAAKIDSNNNGLPTVGDGAGVIAGAAPVRTDGGTVPLP